ncbi:MAG TPA: MATE family efflux transporter [Vicinamibacteria bacterium]|nr:MATE family efflux transporter [Vicinamibacteria bacterium]
MAAELGWMAMGTFDTIMVGRVSTESIGAVGLGSVVFLVPAIFGIGVLLGLDTLVSQAFGGGRVHECHRWLYQGVHLSLLMTVPLAAVLWLGAPAALAAGGVNPDVRLLATEYIRIVTWSLPPLLLYTTFRRYLQSMNRVVPVAVSLATANVVDLVGNWALIFGHLGFPAMGVRGAAWSTVIARVYLAAFLLVAILRYERRQPSGLAQAPGRPRADALRRLLGLGLPAALQLTLEVGVFGAATALAGRLTPDALAAHQIALTVASITFMVPLGISQAGAVRVGQAAGRGDPAGVAAAGWAALTLGVSFMAVAGLSFVLAPRALLAAFAATPAVVAIGVSLLKVAAAFQLFDGMQVVTTGIMRGLGDTRTPMVCNLAGHWGLGLPLGYALCFVGAMGVVGLWVGLSAGLIAVGAVLVVLWTRDVRRLEKRWRR